MKPSYEELEQMLAESQREFRAADATIENLQMQLEKLAAENAGLKDINAWCKTDAFKNMYREFKTAEALGCHDVDCMYDAMLTALMHAPETPATDAVLADVREQAHKEGAYFVANRMLAAWDAGFIDDTAKNAADIARMILTSTEFMADAPEGDFDRSFADGVLEDIAVQLRKDAAQ